jgi:hypothetical protein
MAKRITNAVKVRLPDFSSVSLTYLRLQSNSLSGTIPSSLLSNADINAFIENDLRSIKYLVAYPVTYHISINLSDNAISNMTYSLFQSKTQWMGGNVTI